MSANTFTKRAAEASRTARARAKAMIARASLVKHPAVKEAFESFPLSLRRRVSLSVSEFTNSVFIGMPMRDLDSFKDKRLARVLEAFAGSEWASHTNDYTYNQPNRDYKFTRKHPEGFTIEVGIWAYVKEDSPLCRIVVTGITERVVREEVKEIVCA